MIPAAIIGQVALLMCVIIGLLMWADKPPSHGGRGNGG